MVRLRSSPVVRHLGVLSFYLGLTVLMTWPVAARLGNHMAGVKADNQQFVWTIWVLRQNLVSGSDLFYTTHIYHPEGVSLILHTLALTKSLPGIVLQTMFTPVTTYNLLVLASITLSGYTTWLLVRYLTGCVSVALVGGIIFAYSPVLMAHALAGHLNLISAEGLPFFVFFLLKALDSRQWQHALYAGFAGTYLILSDWTYGLYAAIFVVILFCYRLFTERKQHLQWPILRQYLIIGIVTLGLTSPILLPTIAASRSGNYDITRYVGGAALYVSDIFGFFTPGPDHFLVGDWTQPIFDRFTGGRFEGVVFLGFSVLFLAGLGLVKGGLRRTGFWLVVALVFAVISLGPGLHILGYYRFPWLSWLRMGTIAQQLGVPMKPEWVQMFNEAPMIPLPGAILQLLPVFKWTRAPSRFIVVTMLALAVLSSYGVCYLQGLLKDRRWLCLPASTVVTVLVSVVMLLEFSIVPFPTTPATVPTFYRHLGEEPGDFAILEVPIKPFQFSPQYWQTIHGKRLIYGFLARIPEDRLDQLNLILDEIYTPTGYFEKVDIRYLVLHKDQLAGLQLAEKNSLETALETNFELVGRSGSIRIYRAYPIGDSHQ